MRKRIMFPIRPVSRMACCYNQRWQSSFTIYFSAGSNLINNGKIKTVFKDYNRAVMQKTFIWETWSFCFSSRCVGVLVVNVNTALDFCSCKKKKICFQRTLGFSNFFPFMKQEIRQQESQNLGENVKKQILYRRIPERVLEQYFPTHVPQNTCCMGYE